MRNSSRSWGGTFDIPAKRERINTLDARMADGRNITVRLIGIDTPETRKPGTPVECGAGLVHQDDLGPHGEGAGNAEVGKLYLITCKEEEVAGFNVPMN